MRAGGREVLALTASGEPAPGPAPPRGTDRRPGHGVFGSWRFIVVQTVIVTAWIVLNLLAVAYRWDPYPFILLNLVFSTQSPCPCEDVARA